MADACIYCSDPEFVERSTLYAGMATFLLFPKRTHIAAEDGGHLVCIPRRHVGSRFLLNAVEMLEIDYLSIAGARILAALLGTEWFNYQENGNWTVGTPETQHMHLHIYGRSTKSKDQPYGECLRFPWKRDLTSWHVPPFTQEQVSQARAIVGEILVEDWAKAYRARLHTLTSTKDGDHGSVIPGV